MRPPLDGVVLVTGASSGIGRELARQVAATARAIVLVARREERLQALAEELRAVKAGLAVGVAPCDLTDLDAAGAMLDGVEAEHGAVDVLINNAGVGDIGVFDMAPWRKLSLMIRLNCDALAYLTHRVLPGMIARGRGGILNVSSGFGLQTMPGVAAYCGTKHFVTSLTEGLRMEATGTGVVVTQICPGPVDTEFEGVAGNPTGMDVPGFIQIGPERCARVALKAFRRGRALVIPGFWIGLLMALGRMTPRPVLRLLYRWMGPALRDRQRKLADAQS